MTVNNGTFTTPATLTVTAVDGSGSITALAVSNPGSYTSLSGVDGTVSGGTGTGAVLSLFFTGELAVEWYAIDVSGGTPVFQVVSGIPERWPNRLRP